MDRGLKGTKTQRHDDVFVREPLFEHAGIDENIHGRFVLLTSDCGIRTPCPELLIARNGGFDGIDRYAWKEDRLRFGNFTRRRFDDKAKGPAIGMTLH